MDSFAIEHTPKVWNKQILKKINQKIFLVKRFKKFIRDNSIITNIYRIQAYNSIMCGCFCFGLIDFMLKGKSYKYTKFVIQMCLYKEYINLFCPNDYEKYERIILKNFQ